MLLIRDFAKHIYLSEDNTEVCHIVIFQQKLNHKIVSAVFKLILGQGSEPDFHDHLVYTLKTIVRRTDFSGQFREIISRYKRTSYDNGNVIDG